jgi:transcriptional regulator with XRE-family HTH domain
MTNVSAGRSPTVRLVLGKKLRELREAAGIDPSQLSKLKLGSASTTSRIETGKVPVAPYKVVALCKLYGVDQATTDELESLAYRSSEDSILDDYSDVIPRWFSIYVQLEASASRIRSWEPDVLPGLLQTAAYARAVFEAYRPPLEPTAVERSLAIREQRQRAVFAEQHQAHVFAVLGEGVLARQVGGPAVAAAQLDHLRMLCGSGQATIRVLTFDVGAHAAMEGSFSLLEFDDSDLGDVAYVENAAGAKYIDKARLVPRYREMFDAVYRKSIPLEDYAR